MLGPPSILTDLFKEPGVTHLKYFAKGHVVETLRCVLTILCEGQELVSQQIHSCEVSGEEYSNTHLAFAILLFLQQHP